MEYRMILYGIIPRRTTMSKIDYKELADLLLDHFVEGLGVNEAINFLYTSGYTKEDIYELGFGEMEENNE